MTIKLNSWKWSDGEAVTSRDLVFWMNVMKASPSTEWCGYAAGYFPDNVVSYSAPNSSTFVITFNKAYDPEWFINSELSQIVPMPLAWDRTSLSQPAPTTDNGHLPDTTKAGAAAVYKFLDTAVKQTATWGTSPLWSVVDGPFKLQSFTSTGEVTFVPNATYSGSPKPSISKLVELPFTSEAAIYNEIVAGHQRRHDRRTCRRSTRRRLGADRRGVHVQQGGELLVQLLPVELQQPDGRADLPAAVLPSGASSTWSTSRDGSTRSCTRPPTRPTARSRRRRRARSSTRA